MSNYLSIATVTATLQRTLQQGLQMDVDGARVTTSRPDGSGSGTPETGINLYLYHLKRNSAWGNADMPSRQRKGDIVKRNQLAIDLYYLISFHGNEVELEPHRLLGSALRTLEDKGILAASTIRETINDPTFHYLTDSDLAEQMEMIRAEFVPVSTDELSKVWSVFFQTPYALSVVYKVTVVLLEGEEAAPQALPIRDRLYASSPFHKQPIVDLIVADTGKYQPILANSTLLIRGRMFASLNTQVRLGGVEVAPLTIKDTEIILPLALIPQSALKVGVQSLQVIHRKSPSMPNNGRSRQTATLNRIIPELDPSVESNVFPFVLRPTINTVSLSNIEGYDDEPRSAEITVATDITIGSRQRVVLMLNERSLNDASSYLFSAQKLLEDSQNLTFLIRGVKPGEYLLRIQVDGAESLLEIERNPNSPRFEQYVNPLITIP